ncbi:MAG: hypothetical protein ACRYGC_15650 [Janthinobacterium lividum]
MSSANARPPLSTLNAFVALVGGERWKARLASLGGPPATGWSGRALLQRHAIELMIERLRRCRDAVPTTAERGIAALVADTVALSRRVPAEARQRLADTLAGAMQDGQTLVPFFHVMRTAALQRARGFQVAFPGIEHGDVFDLLIERDGVEAEIACDVMSAEEGRDVHRGAWCRLCDRVDPELQTWLAAHPGRYLLKMTLPQGLRSDRSPDDTSLASLHHRISTLLSEHRRADHDEAAVLRLDPLMLAAAQAEERGLASHLRQEFGPEAHLSVTSAGNAVFVMAARAGRENEIAVALRRRMAAIAPARLTGTRPGILAMFIEDTDRKEWRLLRERLDLEGEARQFLTNREARPVVAVTCSSRVELFGIGQPDGASDGELRFRNPAHPAAKLAALAAAVQSSN